MVTVENFFKKIPTKVKEAGSPDMDTIFHFELTEGAETELYTVSVSNGECVVENRLIGEAECTVRSSKKNFEKLINKDLNPMMALMTGKIKISNTGLMMKYAKILGVM